MPRIRGDGVVLNDQDIAVLKQQCGFANHHEIAFYIRSLDDKGLLAANCGADDSILQATITIDGYCHLDTLMSP